MKKSLAYFSFILYPIYVLVAILIQQILFPMNDISSNIYEFLVKGSLMISLVYGIYKSIISIRDDIRTRKNIASCNAYNQNLASACDEWLVENFNYPATMNDAGFAFFLLWCGDGSKYFSTIEDFLNDQKYSLGYRYGLSYIPSVQRLKDIISYNYFESNSIMVKNSSKKEISFNNGTPIPVSKISDIKLESDSTIIRGASHSTTSINLNSGTRTESILLGNENIYFGSSKSRGHIYGNANTVTHNSPDYEQKDYQILVLVNDIANPLIVLKIGNNKEFAYKIYSILNTIVFSDSGLSIQ